MSALPEPVLPIFSVCPYTSVFLFLSTSSVYLCRRSGQVIWTAKRVITDDLKTVVWSPDKLYFALVYTSGKYSVHLTSSGRLATDSVGSNISCVAWSASSLLTQPNSVNTRLFEPTVSSTPTPTVSVIGTLDGDLIINLCRSLTLPSVFRGQNAVEWASFDEISGTLTFLEGTKLHHYTVPKPETAHRRKMAIFSPSADLEIRALEPKDLVVPLVISDGMLETLISGWKTAKQQFFEYFEYFELFFSHLALNSKEDTSSELEFLFSRAMLFGVVSKNMVEWIQLQHEQGFIRWYKQVQIRLESVKTYLQNDFLASCENLLLNYRVVGAKSHTLSELVRLGYELLYLVVQTSSDFENVAQYIQFIFVNETDRPIAVTKKSEVDMADALDSVQSTFFKDSSLRDMIKDIDARIELARTEFTEVIKDESQQLSTLFQKKWEFSFQEPVLRLEKRGSTIYALSKTKLLRLDEGQITAEKDINKDYIFLGSDSTNAYLDTELRALVVSNGVNKKIVDLEIDPKHVETRLDGNSVVACVLSSDCTQFQVVEFSI